MEKSLFHDKRGKHLTLKQLVENAESIPLSTDDLRILTANKCNIILYEELNTVYSNLTDVLANNSRAIILYDLKGEFGHFVSLMFHHATNSLQFYNSYAIPIDAEIDMFKHPVPVLTLMVQEFMRQNPGVRLDINRFQHQLLRKNSNECGRHAVIRALNSDMTNVQYHDFINGFGIKPPDLVSLMTMSVNFINKNELRQLYKTN